MNFGRMLRTLRNERRLGQKDLANLLHVSISSISNYENNVHEPEFETLAAIADFFDVSLDFLLERTNHRTSPNKMSERLTDHYTMGNLTDQIMKLSPKKRQELVRYVKYLLYLDDTGTDRQQS